MYPLTFIPFVGKSFNNKNIFGDTKIMILGESHYGSVPSADITRDVINRYLDPTVEREGWMSTFLKFERSLVNKETSREDSMTIWNSLMFYNYVQVLMDGPRTAATKQEYKDSEAAFFQVLEENRPDFVIVWGRRLWSNLPYTNWEEGEEVRVDNYNVDNGFYILSSGHKVRVFCVYHPSAGYDWRWWHKVISSFINSEDKATNVIDAMGFCNFRRFAAFPSLSLGGVNIIVGANNAGKSTFDKATKLFLDFIQKWLRGSSTTIHFDSPLCQELGINSYEDAFNYNVDKNSDDLCFNMTTGRYTFEAAFRPGDIEAEENTIANANYVKIVDLEDNSNEYVFHYDRTQNSVIAEATLQTFSPAYDGIDVIERYLGTPMCPIEKDIKATIYSNIDVVRECLESGNYSDGKMLEAFKQIDDSIGGNTPKDYDLFECLRNAISQVAEEHDDINLEITLPRNATPKILFEKLKGISEIQASFDESRRNNPCIIEAKLFPIITLSQKKTFSIYDTDSVSRAVSAFGQKWNNNHANDYYHLDGDATGDDHIAQFLVKWLKKFEIGSNLRFRHLHHEVYTMDVYTLDDHWASLTSFGMGSVHMVTLLLSIANFCLGIGKLTKQVLIIEEPEINLHPNRQSQLADLLIDIYNTFGIQIIVETHSEYLVRKMQVITARLIFDGEKYTKEVNDEFNVYYFPEKGIPYSLIFRNDGHFDRKFGEGFFDEAGRSYHTLTKLERGIR